MLIECLPFDIWRQTTIASTTCSSYRSSVVDLTNAALRCLADLDQISEVLPSAQLSRASWGQRWGQLAFVSIAFHSEVRFPPPPPTSCDVCRRLATAVHLNLTPQRRVPFASARTGLRHRSFR